MLISMILTLSILAIVLICCIQDWLPPDVIAIAGAATLMLLGLVTPEEGISGFSNPATITVMSMFILSAGIARTGAIHEVNDCLLRWGGKHPSRQILTLGVIAGPVTAFINNTAVVAVFLPIVENWCKKQGISVSKLLIPLSYVTILGGLITLIGTSTSVLASGLSQDLGYGSFSLFQFTELGLIAFGVGLIYLALIAPSLLPDRKTPSMDLTHQDYSLEKYITEIVITPCSKLIGKTLASSCIKQIQSCPYQKFDMDVLEMIRHGVHVDHPFDHQKMQAGDILLVNCSRNSLLKIKDEKGVEILPEFKFWVHNGTEEMEASEDGIAEVLIPVNSSLIGSTLQDLRFRQRFNAIVLAVHRGEELIRDGRMPVGDQRLSQISLRFGDVLLVQGPKPSLSGLQHNGNLLVLKHQDLDAMRREKASIAIAIGLGVVVLTGLNLVTITVSSLLGAVLMVITGCLKPGELYSAVRWNIIFLLAGLVPMGIAMEKSGATEMIANGLVAIGGHLSGYWLLTLFFALTSVMTEVLSNSATVILFLPIAAEVAKTLDFNPLAFMLAVTFAASTSFMTPIGYQTNTMVYGPGGYKFLDFFRVGLPLSLLMMVLIPPLIIRIYGL